MVKTCAHTHRTVGDYTLSISEVDGKDMFTVYRAVGVHTFFTSDGDGKGVCTLYRAVSDCLYILCKFWVLFFGKREICLNIFYLLNMS